MKKFFLVSLIFLLQISLVLAHPWKPRHFVVIDTDGGIDDFRAITMMLASPDVRVLGITITPGVLPASDIFNKVSSMLKQYHHEGIPVGINEVPEIKPANFEMAARFDWGNEPGTDFSKAENSTKILDYVYSHSRDSIHFICLGSLNIITRAEKQIKDFESKTAQIIWSCSDVNEKNSFNYNLDRDAYKYVSKLSVPLKIINGKTLRKEIFSDEFANDLKTLNTVYADEISRSLSLPHKIYYDELIPLWIHFPSIFEETTTGKIFLAGLKASVNPTELRTSYLQIISGETVNQNQVINFSWRNEDYFPDVQPIMDETVKKYGKNEWVANVMANEMHRHLGVFAIIGTKMGIRAKEYFNAGIDEMKIVSYAGEIPPFSCMNDGLQISTGATVGHGLISVSRDTLVRPVADFTYMGRTIRLTLKPETGRKIAAEVKELNRIHGLNSDIYWELIRKLAIKYWNSFDRHEIFIIEPIN